MRFTITFMLSVCVLGVSAQEMLGISNSNYGGTNNLMLNPSQVVNPYLKWDINLITLGIHADNNYLYIPNTSLTRLPRTLNEASANDQATPLVQHFNQSRNKQAYVNLLVKGPSAMWNVKGKHGVGFHTALRANASVRGVERALADIIYDASTQDQSIVLDPNLLEIQRFRANAMTWGELGLTYGQVLRDESHYLLKAGGTLKYLHGIAGGYLNNYGSGITQLQDIEYYNTYVDARVGYSNPIDSSARLGFRTRTGMGLGADIGVMYENKRNMRSRYSDLAQKGRDIQYTWRLGVSLMDVGAIYFNKNAERYRANAQNFPNDTVYTDDFIQNNLDPKNNFIMALPTALSIQADYKYTDFIFINATMVQRIPKPWAGTDRENLISVTPRYETRHLEVAIPMVLYEYRHPRIGLAARFGSFVIGSDRLGSLFGQRNFSGTDLYMSIKLSGDYFSKHKPKADKASHSKSRKGRPLRLLRLGSKAKCFYFD